MPFAGLRYGRRASARATLMRALPGDSFGAYNLRKTAAGAYAKGRRYNPEAPRGRTSPSWATEATSLPS